MSTLKVTLREVSRRERTIRGRNRRTDATLKRYAVLVDGEEVGHVEQGVHTRQIKPRGSRIVSYRWEGIGWDASVSLRSNVFMRDKDTRWRAVQEVLREHFGIHFYDATHESGLTLWDLEKAAKAAEVER